MHRSRLDSDANAQRRGNAHGQEASITLRPLQAAAVTCRHTSPSASALGRIDPARPAAARGHLAPAAVRRHRRSRLARRGPRRSLRPQAAAMTRGDRRMRVGSAHEAPRPGMDWSIKVLLGVFEIPILGERGALRGGGGFGERGEAMAGGTRRRHPSQWASHSSRVTSRLRRTQARGSRTCRSTTAAAWVPRGGRPAQWQQSVVMRR